MKSNKVDFSIIVPVYNCEKYLKKCIESIINQSYQNYELILVNDGSIDNSGEICDEFKNLSNKVTVIHQKNSGVSSSRNKGLSLSKGKYIMFFDCDDYVELNYLEYAKKIIEKYDLELLNTGFYSEVESTNDNYYDKITAEEKYYSNYEEIKKDLVYLWDKHMLYNIWNKVYLNSIIKDNNIKFPNYNFGEDMEFNKLYLEHTDKFYNSNKCFYHYIKERKGSLTTKYNQNIFYMREKEYYSFNKYFTEQGFFKEQYEEFSARRFIERVIGCVENICSCELSQKDKINKIKEIIFNKTTIETITIAKPNSKKMKVLLFPIKIKSVKLTYLFGKIVGTVRKRNPKIFNKLKNSR